MLHRKKTNHDTNAQGLTRVAWQTTAVRSCRGTVVI